MLKWAVVTLALFLTLLPEAAHACKCAFLDSAVKEMDRQSVVFVGRVETVSDLEKHELKTTFKVLRSFKGIFPEKKSVDIVSRAHGPACGIRFELNEEYLVFASVYEGSLFTSSCTLTKKRSEAEKNLKELEQVRE